MSPVATSNSTANSNGHGHSGASSGLPMSQEALEAMPFPFAICTCDGIYVGANVRMEQLFQAPSAARIGVFNLLNDPLMQDNDSHAIFQAAVAGQHGQAPLLYYAVPFPATRNPQPGSRGLLGGWRTAAPVLRRARA